MPNLITQYDNGTFEDVLGNWDGVFSAGTTAQIRDATQFYQGAHSCRMTTALINSAGFFGGVAPFLMCSFPGVTGEQYEVIIFVRVDAAIPDDAIFFISPTAIDVSHDNKGYTIPVRASTAKNGWVELRANYYGVATGGELSFFVNVLFSTSEFTTALEFADPAYMAFYNYVLGYDVSTAIPAGGFVYVDAINAEAKAIPEAPDEQFEGTRLYYEENVFYLSIDGARIVINEPIKWDDVKIQVIFDEKSKAYRFEFSDKDVLLEFDNFAGRPILRERYRAKGSNAEVYLIFGRYNRLTETFIEYYTGSLNFGESCEDTEKKFRCNIERQSFGEKLRVYFDTRVNLFRDTTLGGLARPPLALKDLFLHPRFLTYYAEFVYNTNVPAAQAMDAQDPGVGDGTVYVVIPPMKVNGKNNNIENLNAPTPPEGTLVYAGSTLPAGVSKRSFFVECGMSFRYTKTGSVQQPRHGFTVFKVGNISGGGSPEGKYAGQVDVGGYSALGSLLGGVNNVTGIFSAVIDLVADEAMFIRATILNPVAGDPDAVYSNFEWTSPTGHYLRIRELTSFQPTLVQAPLLFDVVNRQVELTVDKANPLVSNFLGRLDLGYTMDGCASRDFALDGKMLRKLPGKPFNLSTKTLFNSLDGLYNLGMSIERDEDENEYLRLEEMPYFFRNVLLLDLKVISNYVRRPASQYLYNELEFGFKKYPQDNQQDSLEDFHTRMSYVTPLTKIKNKLSIIIDAIVSGYYIEYTRRQAFSENPSNAYETDEDLFYIKSRVAEAVHNDQDITFDQDNKQITINKIIPIVAGDKFVIAGATGDVTNGTYTVTVAEIPYDFDRVILTVEEALATDGGGTGDVTIVDALGNPVERHEAKRDEDFDEISGVTFAKSVYNLEHQIKRIALRWAKLFQSGWSFLVDGGDIFGAGIQFTGDGANNTEATTQLKSAVSCKYGDTLRMDRRDSGFESVNAMDDPLFGKDVIEFDAPLTWTTFNYIRFAYEGRNPDGKDYGYIRFPNPDREIERGFNLGLKFDPNTQMCKFTLIEKFPANG